MVDTESKWKNLAKVVMMNENARNLDDDVMDSLIFELKERNHINLKYATKVLGYVTETDLQSRVRLGVKGAIPLLLSLLNYEEKEDGTDGGLQVRLITMRIMANLAEVPSNQERIALHGVIPQLISMYHKDPRSELGASSLTILKTLSKTTKFKQMIVGGGLEKTLLKPSQTPSPSFMSFMGSFKKKSQPKNISKPAFNIDASTELSASCQPAVTSLKSSDSKTIKRKSAPSSKRGYVEHGSPSTKSERSNSDSISHDIVSNNTNNSLPNELSPDSKPKSPSPRTAKKKKHKSKRISDRYNTSSVSSDKPDKKLRIKCDLDGDKRFIWVTEKNITVEEFIDAIEKEYKTKLSVGQLKFRDPGYEHDLITLSKKEDLQLCFSSEETPEIFILHLKKQKSTGRYGDATEQQKKIKKRKSVNNNNNNQTLNKSKPERPSNLKEFIDYKKHDMVMDSVTDEQVLHSPLSHSQPPRMLIKQEKPQLNNRFASSASHIEKQESSRDSPKIESSLSTSGKKNDKKYASMGDRRWIIPSSDLKISMDEEPLGSGFFGEVRLGTWRSIRVACKFVYEKSFRNKSDFELFVQEVNILSSLRHPNVILYMGVVVDRKDKIIVTEFMEKGSLYNLIKEKKLNFNLILKISKDIALGMNYLHGENIFHRDLTTKNILLTKHMEAKVSDFGLSKIKLEGQNTSYTMGSVVYMSPEVIQSAKNFSTKSDVYSYGIVLWELFTGEDPCPKGLAHVNLANKVLHEEYRPKIPDDVPIIWTNLIKASWSQQQDKRPSFDIILLMLEEIEKNPPVEKLTHIDDDNDHIDRLNNTTARNVTLSEEESLHEACDYMERLSIEEEC